ncbi:MAG TPA: response regulator transcription factor [Chryseosolibacter sp.]
MKNFYKTRVLIVENDSLLREAYATILSGSINSCVVTFTTGKLSPDLVELKGKLFDLAIIDVDSNDAGCIRKLKDQFFHLKLLLTTEHVDLDYLQPYLKIGVGGVLLKDRDFNFLVSSVESLINGGAPMSRAFARTIVESFRLNTNSPLTRRETEVLELLVNGENSTNISERLEITQHTSRKHISNIYSKLKVTSRAEAIKIATREKLIISGVGSDRSSRIN